MEVPKIQKKSRTGMPKTEQSRQQLNNFINHARFKRI